MDTPVPAQAVTSPSPRTIPAQLFPQPTPGLNSPPPVVAVCRKATGGPPIAEGDTLQ
jgi:hypothetical protein